MRPTRGLLLERLEDRLTPSATEAIGLPWPARTLTVSFVPDGTAAAGHVSNLNTVMGTQYSGLQWQSEVLRAFQFWLEQVDLDVAVVADNGQPLGTSGAIQHDGRFGDVRIAGYAMPAGVLAVASPFDPLAGTWSGDLKFNTDVAFGAGGYDLFTVALHEVGHALGLDHADDPRSVMYPRYQGVRTGLSAGDVEHLLDLYGPRLTDEFDARMSNDSIGTATSLQVAGNGPTMVEADLTTDTDTDHYHIRLNSAMDGVRVRLVVAGRSLLAGELTLMDASGNVLARTQANAPGENLELSLSQLPPGGELILAVRSTDPQFAVGGYHLEVAPVVGYSVITPDPGGAAFAAAQGPQLITLQARRYRGDDRFSYYADGQIDQPGQAVLYRFKTPHVKGGSGGPLTVLAWSNVPGAFRPRLTLLDSTGRVVPARVLVNQDGTFLLQLDRPLSNAQYLLRVEGAGQVGGFRLGILFSGKPADLLPLLGDAPVSGGQVATGTLHLAQSKLMHFVLGIAGPNEGVAMVIRDSAGRVVGTLAGPNGQVVSTTLFLRTGDYQVELRNRGEVTARIDLSVAGLSSPIGPEASDVKGVPQPLAGRAGTLGFWWEMGRTGFVVGPGESGGPNEQGGRTAQGPLGPISPLGVGSAEEGRGEPAAGNRPAGQSADGVIAPGANLLAAAAAVPAGPTTSGAPGGAPGSATAAGAVAARVGGGGVEVAEAPPVVPPATAGLVVPVPMPGEASATPEGTVASLPTLTAPTAPTPGTDAPAIAGWIPAADVPSVTPEAPVAGSSWLFRALALAGLAGATTLWLWHRPRRDA